MSALPRVTAEWMVFHLANRRGQDHVVDILEKGDLGFLNVKELKQLGEILYSMPAVVDEASIRERRLPSSAKKQRRVDFLRRGLFRDDSCTVINNRLVQAMRSETRRSSPAMPAATCAASGSHSRSPVAFERRKRPSTQISQHNQPQQQQQQQQQQRQQQQQQRQQQQRQQQQRQQQQRQQRQQQQQQRQQNRISAHDLSAMLNEYYTSSQFDPQPLLTAPFGPGHSLGQNIWSDMPISPISPGHHLFHSLNGGPMGGTSRASEGTGPSSNTTTTTSDPQSAPQNPAEAILLQQLLEMGFQKQEILDGIRQCQSNSGAVPSADEVMLRLVSQREEAEEARKEDEARLMSEQHKQEESNRREQNQKESLSKAATGKDLKAIFPESWVLAVILANSTDAKDGNLSICTILGSNSRNDFLEFLKLEEKSRKWYGWVLPAEYFRKVGRRLKSAGDKGQASSWVTFLRSEREKLRCGLYELKEQLKGQPKIFLDERPKENSVSAAEVVIIDDD